MDNTAYSVLMSVYRKEKGEYLRTAINSMLSQTVMPQQFVLVEDGPLTDELYEVIHDFEMKYPSLFTIVKNEKNLGLGLALQKGILACRNEMIARMDSDDIAHSDRIEKELQVFRNDSYVSICGSWIEEFAGEDIENKTGIRKVPGNDAEIKEYLRKRCPFNHMTVLYKKSDVLKAGNYQDYLYNEDYLLWIRMLEAGCRFANVEEVLVDVRTDPDMYQNRRGGDAYYQSEKGIQDILLKDGIIDKATYLMNIMKRFLLQKAMTPSMRAFVFRMFARSKN